MKMKKTAFLIMMLTIISKVVGFGRELTLAYFYGASNISDAFLIALTIPITIFAFIGKSINTGYVPLYTKIDSSKNKGCADRFTNNLINISILICLFVSIVCFIFAEPIVKTFASGFEGDTLALAVTFTRISILGISFTVVMEIFSSLLRIKGNYLMPAMVAFPMNASIIIAIIISSKGNALVLGFGILFSVISQLLFLLPSVSKINFKYKFIMNIKDSDISRLLMLSTPIMIGVAVNDINKIVNRTIASNISEGAISSLNYADMINGFIQGIFVLSIATTIYPIMSKSVSENKIELLKKILSESITGVNLLVIPSALGLLIFSKEIITLLYGRGAFDELAISMTSEALFFYSLGILGIGLREILSRPFYALQDTKTPVVNAAVGICLNIVLNIILSRFLGIGGLALATSISATFTSALLFISLRKKIGPFGMKQIGISFIKILFASSLMSILSKFSFSFLITSFSQNFSLILSIGIGVVLYFVIIYFMKIEDVDAIVGAIKKKFGK
jgi:putative peptidoglycan lipid II flippase